MSKPLENNIYFLPNNYTERTPLHKLSAVHYVRVCRPHRMLVSLDVLMCDVCESSDAGAKWCLLDFNWRLPEAQSNTDKLLFKKKTPETASAHSKVQVRSGDLMVRELGT